MRGDFNAKVGGETNIAERATGCFDLGQRNESGDTLLEWATSKNFKIINTQFQKKAGRRWKWEDLMETLKMKSTTSWLTSRAWLPTWPSWTASTFYQLKRAGISQNDLVKIYVSIIRPVLEYACPVWSTSLPTYLSDAIEMIQKRVLRSIHPGLHYDDILVLVGLQSLKKRRDNICKAYFNRLKRNTHRLNHLIPERRDVHYSIRNANV